MSVFLTIPASNVGDSHEEQVRVVADALKGGELVILPTDTSYALCADAFHAAAVKKLRELKGQDESISLPVAGWSIDAIRGVAQFSDVALDLAHAFWPGALTILTRPQASLAWSLADADQVMPVRVPQHSFLTDVLRLVGPTVMTGAQSQGGSPVTVCSDTYSYGDAVSVYVDGGEASGNVSTIIDASGQHLRMIRSGELSLAQLRDVVPTIVDATARRDGSAS